MENKETIEKAAEKYNDKFQENAGSKPPYIKNQHIMNHFIAGANYQAERMYSSLSKARNELYDKLPTGDIDAFELLKLIKIHLQKLDDLCGNK